MPKQPHKHLKSFATRKSEVVRTHVIRKIITFSVVFSPVVAQLVWMAKKWRKFSVFPIDSAFDIGFLKTVALGSTQIRSVWVLPM